MAGGYHLTDIPKGVYGQFSKIEEEFLELKDAHEQGVTVMELVELSNLLSAIRGYLKEAYGGSVQLSDLNRFAEVTERAFEAGEREAKPVSEPDEKPLSRYPIDPSFMCNLVNSRPVLSEADDDWKSRTGYGRNE